MLIERIGKVQILDTLGAGAQSSIMKVRRNEDGKEYALKIVPIETEDDKKYLEQARYEYRIGEMLDHPNCIKIFCFETESDWLFRVKKAKLLIEYVNGKTLDRVKLVSIPKLLKVFEQIAAGLVHMHKQGVYHADMKPNNVMLSRSGAVKIIDYGLAWVKGEPKDRVQGTPEYIAPETVSHKLINERTDIFNFGVTMYRLVTLKLPPKIATSADDIPHDEKSYKTAITAPRESNKACPVELEDLILRCLSFNANKRPERMSAIQGDLDRLCDRYAADVDLAGSTD